MLKYFPERMGKTYLINTGMVLQSSFTFRASLVMTSNADLHCGLELRSRSGFIFWALWKLLSPFLPQRTKDKVSSI